MSRKWVAVVAVYGLVLVLFAALIAFEADASVRTRLIEIVVFVGVPAVVFALGVLPLLRESRSRLAHLAAGAVASIVAFVLVIVTWGFALPLSAGLLAVAIADFDRALVLSGLAANRRIVAFGVVLVVGGFLLGLAVPLAALAAVVGIAVIAWRLLSTRRGGRHEILPP